jgi:hypothetical protein
MVWTDAAACARTRGAAKRQARQHSDAPADRRIAPQDQGTGRRPQAGDRAGAGLGANRAAPRLEDALADLGAEQEEVEQEELTQQLVRIPDLTQALREAPVPVKRQVFESFNLQIAYAKRQVALTALSEAVADAFENAKALQVEGSVRLREIR